MQSEALNSLCEKMSPLSVHLGTGPSNNQVAEFIDLHFASTNSNNLGMYIGLVLTNRNGRDVGSKFSLLLFLISGMTQEFKVWACGNISEITLQHKYELQIHRVLIPK